MRKFLLLISVLCFFPLLIFFSVFCFNQIHIFTGFIETIIPDSAFYLNIFFIILYFTLICSIIYFFISIPEKPDLKLEKDNTDKLISHLKKNKLLKDINISEAETEKCIEILNNSAKSEIMKISSEVFLSTSLSQWGKIDGLIILVQQLRLVWKIIRIYNSRPSYAYIFSIYTNVFISSLLSFSIEEADIIHYIEPIIDESLESSASGIPIVGNIAQLIASSIFSGTVNCALTARTGLIAQDLSNPYSAYFRKKHILLEVSRLTSTVLLENGKTIAKVLYKKGFKSIGKFLSKIKDSISKRF